MPPSLSPSGNLSRGMGAARPLPGPLFEVVPATLARRSRFGPEDVAVKDLREQVLFRVELACKLLRRDMLDRDREKALGQVNRLFEFMKQQPGFDAIEFRNHAMVDPMIVGNFNKPRGRHNVPPETYARPGHYEARPSPSWRRRSAKKHLLAVLIRSMHRKLNRDSYGAHFVHLERVPAYRAVQEGSPLTHRQLCEHLYHNSARSYWTEGAMQAMLGRVTAAEAYLREAAFEWLDQA